MKVNHFPHLSEKNSFITPFDKYVMLSSRAWQYVCVSNSINQKIENYEKDRFGAVCSGFCFVQQCQ
jgi:hypothetical protein